MPPKAIVPDELEWEQPQTLLELPGGDLNSESIMWYFMSSPFFDGASNNVALFTQVRGSPDGQALLNSRDKFEEALQTRFPLGLQFIVTGVPQEKGQPWVIQRQMKYKPTDEKGNVLDRVDMQVQGTYYTVGNRILMAPSLLDVVQSRLLSTSIYLQELFELSKSLTHYSPATGHTYLPPSYESTKATAAGSAAGRLESPGLDASHVTASQTHPVPETSATEFSDDFFLASLAATNAYGHEYMDENPLQGEPGSFVFGTTTRQVEARNKAQAAAAQAIASTTITVPAKQSEVEIGLDNTPSGALTPKPAPTPLSIPVPAAADAGSRKGIMAGVPAKLGKKDRRKSKGLASPITPNAPVGP